MKKLLSILLIVAMVFTMAGCSLDIKGLLGGLSELPTTTPSKTLTRGTIEGTVYTNEFLGFTFTRPSSWVYSTDDEIAAALNIGLEALGQEKFKESLENSDSLYDMMVKDILTGNNVSVGYENLKASLSSNITEEQYLEAVKTQLAAIPNMQYTFSDTGETIKLGDTTFYKMVCTAEYSGFTMTQVYYLHKVDNYMGFIIATFVTDFSIADFEACFN